jgi:hypothetical protein
MVIVDELLATFDTVGVIPVGADPAVVPAAFVYQTTVPVVPAAIFAVVATNVAVPAVPPVIVPDCAARLTVAGAAATVNISTEEDTEPNVTLK